MLSKIIFAAKHFIRISPTKKPDGYQPDLDITPYKFQIVMVEDRVYWKIGNRWITSDQRTLYRISNYLFLVCIIANLFCLAGLLATNNVGYSYGIFFTWIFAYIANSFQRLLQ